MGRKKGRGRGATPADPAQPEATGFWALRLGPFLERRSVALAVCLVAIASARIAATYWQLSLTVDEPVHFAFGLEYLSRHVYPSGGEHPPLARAASAVGPYLDGVRPIGTPNSELDGVKVVRNSRNPERLVALMRLGILPFFWIACAAIYLWARRGFDNTVAVTAVGLFSLIPPVLAHAGLATTDMALAAWVTGAFVALLAWADSPTWKNAVLLGVAGALAALSKFTALGYVPAAAGMALVLWFATERPEMRRLGILARSRAASLGLAVAASAVTIWGFCWFSLGKPSPAWPFSVPAPEYFSGILGALSHNQEGHPAYLLGEFSAKGWWYYFPVALAVKTPLAFLLLLIPGLAVCLRHRARPGYLFPLAFTLGILLPAMNSRINIGVRHILPIYAGLAIVAAVGLVHLAEWARSGKRIALIAGSLVVWLAVSGAIHHPDYLAYFNELADSEPYRVLVDSDLEWGQDYKLLARRFQQAGVTEFNAGFVTQEPIIKLYGLPPWKGFSIYYAKEGWNVLSGNLRVIPRPGVATDTDQAPWYHLVAPTERIGGLLLYYVPPRPTGTAR